MYNTYFNLKRNPFDLTPDPNCFVPTPQHNEALAALYYGVRRHKGFVVVTGEVGTGKTLLLRCLLRLLEDSKDIAYAYLFNSRLTPTEFLQYVVSDFGIPASGKNKCDFLLDLSKFLVTRGARQLTTVLIVDEAHDLPVETLEELRLLEPGDDRRQTDSDHSYGTARTRCEARLRRASATQTTNSAANATGSPHRQADPGVHRAAAADCGSRSGLTSTVFSTGHRGCAFLFARVSTAHQYHL